MSDCLTGGGLRSSAALLLNYAHLYFNFECNVDFDISSFRFVGASARKKSVSLFNSPLNAIQDIDLRPTLPFYARTFYSQAVDKAGNVEKGKTVPEATIKLKLAPTVFTFNGSGDYRNPANWVGNLLPPDVLPAGSEIIINPAGNSECRMNKPQEVKPGGKFTVLAGKKIRLPGAIEVR